MQLDNRVALFGDDAEQSRRTLPWTWSSSPHASYSDFAWDVDFSYGGVNVSNKYGTKDVRLVRAGQ